MTAAQVANARLQQDDVLVDEKPLRLTAFEFRVLALLLQAGDGALTSKAALTGVLYGDNTRPASTNVIEVIVSRLRRILHHAGAQLEIASLRGRGYVLRAVTGQVAR